MTVWVCLKLLSHMVVYTCGTVCKTMPQASTTVAGINVLSKQTSFDVMLTVPPQVLVSLSLWRNPSSLTSGVPLATLPPQPLVTLVTDASGAHLGSLRTQGL